MLYILLANSPAEAQSKVEAIKIKASIYCDHCKECESCGPRLEEAIYEVKGVKRVDIDEVSSTLKVVYNTQRTSADAIRQAITKAGFDADDLEADPEAYARLDECCKKK